jgi:hypothetical protein
MKRASLIALAWVGLASLMLVTGGCVGGYVEGGDVGPVYGDFGATGAWGYDGPTYDEVGVYVQPPYRGGDRHDDHRDDHRGGAPSHGAAPSHDAPRAPSIPSAPRPSGGGGHSGGAPAHSGGGERKR